MNVGTALCFLGESTEGFEVYKEYYEVARAFGVREWQFEFASSACWISQEREDYESASIWFERELSSGADPTHGHMRNRRHLANAAELAMWHGDLENARAFAAELTRIDTSESLRIRAYVDSFDARIQQRDPHCRLSDDAIEKLRSAYEKVRHLGSVDYLVVVLGEALRRRGELEQARTLLREYLMLYRREKSSVPRSFVDLANRCEIAGLSLLLDAESPERRYL
jgi:tetratricopeptide (TPR) repeat protein